MRCQSRAGFCSVPRPGAHTRSRTFARPALPCALVLARGPNSRAEVVPSRARRCHLPRCCAGSVRELAAHPELPVLASVGLDRYLRLHDRHTRQLLAKVYLKTLPTGVAFCPTDASMLPPPAEPAAATQGSGKERRRRRGEAAAAAAGSEDDAGEGQVDSEDDEGSEEEQGPRQRRAEQQQRKKRSRQRSEGKRSRQRTAAEDSD